MRSAGVTIVALGVSLLTAAALAHPPRFAARPDEMLRLAGPVEVVEKGAACTALLARADELWIGTSAHGVLRVAGGETTRWAPGPSGLPRGRVMELLEDGSTLWARMAPESIARLQDGSWHGVPGPPGFVHDLAFHGGRLWAATSQGLYERAGEDWRRRGGDAAVLALASEGSRQLWWVTGDGRLMRGEPLPSADAERGAEAVTVPGPASHRVRCLAVTSERVYLGRYGGLTVLTNDDELRTDASLEPPPVIPAVVSGIAEENGTVLVGSWGEGMLHLSGGTWSLLDRRQGLPSDRVNAVALTRGYFAVATDRGTLVAPRGEGGPTPLRRPNPVRASAPTAAAVLPDAESIDPTAAGLRIEKPDPLPRQILRSVEQGGEMSPLARLGDVLFEDPTMLGPRAQSLGISCGTCHPAGDTNPGFFIPGLSSVPGTVDLSHRYFNAAAHNGRSDPVDIPSLRGVRLTGPYGKDGRTGSLREFVRNVIVLEFGGDEPAVRDLDALTAYCNEFELLPNGRLGPAGRLLATAPRSALRGEAEFHAPREGFGGRSCASCHDASAYFTDRRSHDVGSGGGFDTPTLLGSLRTAPYFHDGSKATFDDVVRHFDRTFGLGLGEGARRDLVAYLEAIGDVDGPWEERPATRAPQAPEPSGQTPAE